MNEVFGTAVGTLQRERVAKRYEIARRLVSCIKDDLARGDVSSLCFAEIEVADLEAFLAYFAAEREAWKTFPENPEVKPVMVRLEDFGAVGDGVADDAPAFRAAIAAVKKLDGAPSMLCIPAGTFLLASPDPLTPGERQTNLVFPALTNCIVTGVSPERTFMRFGIYDARGICVRSFSTNADGFFNSRGSWISDCEFTNMGDDGCNSHMRGGDIVKADGRTLLCKGLGLPLRIGELCQIVESTTGEYLANLHVASTGTAE